MGPCILTMLLFTLSASEPIVPPAPLSIIYETFGEITVNGEVITHDIVIDKGEVRKRKKGPSKELKSKYGHTPLTPQEKIPWDCKILVVGTGIHGSLPIVDEFKEEAKRRGVELIILKTKDAVEYLKHNSSKAPNAILHITC